MNYELLEGIQCPNCYGLLRSSNNKWRDRGLRQRNYQSCCDLCNIAYRYLDGEYLLIRQIDSTRAVLEVIDLKKGVLSSEELIPSEDRFEILYELPNKTRWQIPPGKGKTQHEREMIKKIMRPKLWHLITLNRRKYG